MRFWQPSGLKSETKEEVPETCIMSDGHQGATPLVKKD